MAPQATSRTIATGPSRGAMSRAQKVSLVAAVIAAFNKASLNNVIASAAVAIAAPAAATAFVYEVSSLRDAQLAHEETDRSSFLRVATQETSVSPPRSADPSAVPAGPGSDIGRKLDGMIASRAKMLDLFGDDPSTVAPVYARIIQQMVNDDNATFASLSDRQANAEAGSLAAQEARLRAVHARLVHLLGA